MMNCHQGHCAWTFFIYLFLYNFVQFCVSIKASSNRTAIFFLIFFFFSVQTTFMFIHCLTCTSQKPIFKPDLDFFFRLLMAVDGFWHQPLLHQRGVFAQRPAARWRLLFLQISERDRRTWKSREFGRPMRPTRTIIEITFPPGSWE